MLASKKTSASNMHLNLVFHYSAVEYTTGKSIVQVNVGKKFTRTASIDIKVYSAIFRNPSLRDAKCIFKCMLIS